MEKRPKTPSSPSSSTSDRLSSLHDSVLLHILSFLPIRDAIATSSLSARFRRTWTSIPSLAFTLSTPKDAAFIDRLLPLLTSSSLSSFSLTSDLPLDAPRLSAWTHFALVRHVTHLHLHLRSFPLPLLLPSFYPSQTLESLSLRALVRSPLPLPDPSSPCFPNLRVLKLQLAFESGGDAIAGIVKRCAQLEVLHLTATVFEVLEISCPNLRTLQVGIERCSELRVFSPKLKYFRVLVKEPVRDFRGEMPVLCRADVKVPSNSGNAGFWKGLFRGVNNAAVLHFGYLDFKLSSKDWSKESYNHLPALHNLWALNLGACFHHDNMELVASLLESSPKLKVLFIKLEANCSCFDKRKKWTSRKLQSKILDNLRAVIISNGVRRKIINKREFVKFLAINVTDWKKVIKKM